MTRTDSTVGLGREHIHDLVPVTGGAADPTVKQVFAVMVPDLSTADWAG